MIDTNKLEAIIADHDKAMRTDIASKITGDTPRSAGITRLITVEAIIGMFREEYKKGYIDAGLTSLDEQTDPAIMETGYRGEQDE